MKRVFALVLTLAMVLGLAACGGGEGESGESMVRIGIFEPATGDNGAGGKQEMLGMQYANKETPTVDIGGTTYNVELVYIQDQDMIENQEDAGLGLNCPNCGAPLPGLGAKKCIYCDTPIVEYNLRVWNFSRVEEV